MTAGMMFLLICANPAVAASLIVEGRQDAVLECSACHRVAAHQKQPAPVYDSNEGRSLIAPSFDRIARRYAYRSKALRAFIRAPRHPMREQQFLERDLKALSRYIASLRGQRW